MIAWAEGTSVIPGSDDGYRVIVTSTPAEPILFDSYDDHPRRVMRLSGTLFSSAAGRYQLLARYYDAYQASLNLTDFSPGNQDLIAIQQIRECKALRAVERGYFAEAV